VNGERANINRVPSTGKNIVDVVIQIPKLVAKLTNCILMIETFIVPIDDFINQTTSFTLDSNFTFNQIVRIEHVDRHFNKNWAWSIRLCFL
jgi:hypothetical protein